MWHFNGNFWYDILIDILMGNFYRAFWWKMLMENFYGTFWWDIFIAFDDRWWPLLTVDDCWWQLMTIDDLWWPLMNGDDLWNGNDGNGMASWQFWLSLVLCISRNSFKYKYWLCSKTHKSIIDIQSSPVLPDILWHQPQAASLTLTPGKNLGEKRDYTIVNDIV